MSNDPTAYPQRTVVNTSLFEKNNRAYLQSCVQDDDHLRLSISKPVSIIPVTIDPDTALKFAAYLRFQLNQGVEGIVNLLEESIHDSWVATQARKGVTWGEKTSATEKTHRNMKPVHLLDENERRVDRATAQVTVLSVARILEALSRGEEWSQAGLSSEKGMPYHDYILACIAQAEANQQEIDFADDEIQLTYGEFQIFANFLRYQLSQRDLARALAEATHDSWTAERARQGYTWGAERRDDNPKFHDNMLPATGLTDEVLAWDINTARASIYRLAQALDVQARSTMEVPRVNS